MAKKKRKKSIPAAVVKVAEKLGSKEYEKHLFELHVELVHLQEWVKQQGLKVCILFEGRDGAGKGGVIKALTDAALN